MSDNPFINDSDFQSIHLEVSLVNNNTGLMLKDGKQIFKDRAKNFGLTKNPRKSYIKKKPNNARIDFCEFLDQGVILEVPKMSCADKHSLTVLIETFHGKEVQFLVTATVEKVETIAEDRDRIDLKFSQYDKEDWEALQNIFGSRQDDILEFFDSVKG